MIDEHKRKKEEQAAAKEKRLMRRRAKANFMAYLTECSLPEEVAADEV